MIYQKLSKTLKAAFLFIAMLGICLPAYSWQKEYEHPTSPEHDLGMTIITAVDDPSATVTAGTSIVNPYGKEVATVSKIDMNGSVMWSFFYQTPQAKNQRILSIDYSVGRTGYLLVGYYEDIVSGTFHSIVMEIDMNGTLMWQKTYTELTVALKVLKTSNDEYLIGGFESEDLNESTWTREGVLLKINSTGTVQWRRHFTTPVVTRPEKIQNFVETIIELDNNEYYISGSVSTIRTYYGISTKVQKVLSAKVDDNGTLMWNRSFGSFATTLPSIVNRDIEIGTDAVYDPNNQQIYLVTNTNIVGSGSHLSTVYEIDPVAGNPIVVANFYHASSPAAALEGWHSNQIELDGNDIRIYGYATQYLDANNCLTSYAIFPFDFVFDRSSPTTNTMIVHKNDGQYYPLSHQGFLGLNTPPSGLILPMVHTPDMGIRRTDGGNDYTTLLSYGEGPDHGFELFDDLHGMPICNTDYTYMTVLSNLGHRFLDITWSNPPTHTKSLAFQQNDANLSDVDCTPYMCPNMAPNETTSVDDIANTLEMDIYPNPTSGNLVIETNETIELGARLSLTDLLGRTCFEAPLQKKLIVDLSSFKQGTYIVRISNGHKTQYQKVVRE